MLGELPQFNSLQYNRGYYDIGNFHLEVSPGASCADLLAQGVILFPPDAPHKLMLVEDYYIDDDLIKVDGCQLKGDVRKRLIVPPLSLPTKLFRWNGTVWQTITDAATIRELMQGDVYEGYSYPATPFNGMVYVDMTELASVYNWDGKTQTGETWLDLGTAQLRSKYKNFGWDSVIGPAETAIKHFVKNNMTAPEDVKRIVPRLTAAQDLERGLTLPWRFRFEKLDMALAAIGEATGMGYDVMADFANKRFIFDIMEGRDLSQGTKKVVISTDMGNAQSVQLLLQLSNTYTTAYTGGAGEDAERLILTVGNEQTGTERREMWVDAGSVDNPDDLALNGKNKLAEAAPTQTLTAKVIDTGACRYERDWDVGDRVLIRRAGALTATRVLSVTESYERDRPRQLDVEFGTSPVTIAGLIKRAASAAIR